MRMRQCICMCMTVLGTSLQSAAYAELLLPLPPFQCLDQSLLQQSSEAGSCMDKDLPLEIAFCWVLLRQPKVLAAISSSAGLC